ncbi:hypothetical protein CDL12_20469 [Handroanthus impetiginosus]|uniref:DUF3741 domain-containing protein n=1 Tax=Handroanthus impetiginosus TaxID=429701 RepID=A0A2G9GNY9_9LAMI|nr:hypothetical protein CDL12_20469 [Handroanthus impetiginosus]
MSNMTTKSDFAQKLLSDLRLRKEKMAATQNSSRQSGQSSRVVHGNSDRSSRGSRQINALESAGSRSRNTSRRSNGSSRSINTNESSSQIVLYEGGQSSKQVRDLSMAIAFAFENSGNLTKIGGSSGNPLVNFFNQFGRRSLDRHKMDITSFNNHSQFPSVSNIHINEISKGVQKLNQILRACSNGLNFDRNSIEVGKQLLKGAVDLEESLRMLANLQEGSKHVTGAQKKSRLKLLEEDEDDQDDKIADEWKLDRPRFSFDKTSRNSNVVRRQQLALSYTDETSGKSKMVLHRRSSSYVQDLSLSTEGKISNNTSSSMSTQEKGRLSNVIAKLMGLEELPVKDDAMCMQNDSKGKQGKVLRKNTKLAEPLDRQSKNGSPLSNDKRPIVTNNTPQIRGSKIQLKAEKSHESPDCSSKMVNSDRNQLRKDLNVLADSTEAVPRPKLANTVKNKQQSRAVVSNEVNGLRSFEDTERNQNLMDNNERQIQGKRANSKAKNSKILNTEDKAHNRTEHKVSENSREKISVDKDIPSNRQKPQDEDVLLQEQVLERTARSEEKRRAEQKSEQLQKRNRIAKNLEGHQVESVIGTTSKRSTAMNSQKKLSHDKSATGNGRSTKATEKIPMKDPPNESHQAIGPVIEISLKTASNQEGFKKEEPSHDLPPREPQFDKQKESSNQVLRKEKPKEAAVTPKKAIPGKVQKNKIPRKIDVLITRRNATVNQSTRPIKQPANMLRDLKQQMHNKNRSSRSMLEQSDSKIKEEKAGISINNESEMSSEPGRQQDKLQSKADQSITLNHPLNDNCDAIALNLGEVSDDLQTVEQPYALTDKQELNQCDQNIGDHEESKELYNLSQHEHKQSPALVRQEPLTEPEKELKEIVIKSQLFLSTSEALFRLNIPISFLHVSDQDNIVADKKLVLDCAYEVMKRKARRHEVTYHPYTKNTISCSKVRSLDDLVKQLCKDLEMLKFYGENESDIATGLYKMLHKDIYNTYPDVNTMWDYEWSTMMSVFPEKEDVIRDVEKHVLNGLLEEISNDLLVITVSV